MAEEPTDDIDDATPDVSTDDIDDETPDVSTDANETVQISSTYKVLGEFTDESGAGVLGKNNAESGTPVGVEGAVPNASGGYGLSTPHDARIEGVIDTDTNDFVVAAGTQATDDARNVVVGHSSNAVGTGVVGATIGGGGQDDGSIDYPNSVYGNYGTVAGGRGNRVGTSSEDPSSDRWATVGGGYRNRATDYSATVAGGNRNQATDGNATVGGGADNSAGGNISTVGGGYDNHATGGNTTIGGGYDNHATANMATVSGGKRNAAEGSGATVGGGLENDAEADYATIAGGGPSDLGSPGDTNNEVLSNYGTVGGGGNNQAGDASGTFAAEYATVPGGRNNQASGHYSFAAGRSAAAAHDGTFVWSDSGSSTFSSTGADQFLVDAGGGVGIGTDSPRTKMDVVGSASGSSNTLDNHVAVIENTGGGGDEDVLALKVSETDDILETWNHFLTFFNGNEKEMGSIEGNDAGGVQLNSASGDYAEYMPRLDPAEEIEPADVVGVVDGQVTKRTAAADQVLVVSEQAIVTGNCPGYDAEACNEYEVCAFVGQVPVKVRGSVAEGDLVVPSGEHDGTGRAIPPADYRPDDGPMVGRAWESADAEGVSEVTVSVGLETGDALAPTLASHQETIDDLEADAAQKDARIAEVEADNETLRAENEQLRERLAALEDRVAALASDTGGTAAPADD